MCCRAEWVNIELITFGTANGAAQAEHGLPMLLEALGGQYATPYIMASTPALISVGMRVVNSGYAFIWLPQRMPCFITAFPTPRVVPLMVQQDIPYLDEATLKKYQGCTVEQLGDLTGVYVSGMEISIRHPLAAKAREATVSAAARPTELAD